ncbi:MAG: hypothetical protein LBG92_01955 [Prevotellaceae bacterium]|jgi:hypothetical protein|nr:hypothetical protein [Prevotellaceae bacterium]
MKNIIFTLKKTAYRFGRLLYVLRKNSIGKWISILSKSRKEILFESIILRYEGDDRYRQEIDFLKEKGTIHFIPYENRQQTENIVAGYDADKNLPYVVHKNRKLYFTGSWTKEKALWQYKNFIESERILGKNAFEKAPHQYQTESFCVKESDILLDIGCAEALFALEAIDRVKKVFLFECDEIWFKPLEATFEKEMTSGKVILIKKHVGRENTGNTVTIDTVLENEQYDSLFIKMDIEGCETEVVKSCESWMQTDKEIKFSCCTYHYQDDAKKLLHFFEKNGYYTEFSEGYIMHHNDKLIKYPYFRKGVIRASNKKHNRKS